MENNINITFEKYEELLGFKRMVKENAVIERRILTENGSRHEELRIYTQEDYQKKIEGMCEVLYSTGQVDENDMKELFALRSMVTRLKASLALSENRCKELREGTVSKEEYEEVKSRLEELELEPPYRQLFNSLLFANVVVAMTYLIGKYVFN